MNMSTDTVKKVTASKDRTNQELVKSILFWSLQILGAFIFIMAGYKKLIGNPMMVESFDKIGLGQWFRYFTGAIEVGSAILLLIPGYAAFGTVLLIPTMIGAVASHLLVLGGSPALPAGLLLCMIIVAYGRRDQILRFFRR